MLKNIECHKSVIVLRSKPIRTDQNQASFRLLLLREMLIGLQHIELTSEFLWIDALTHSFSHESVNPTLRDV